MLAYFFMVIILVTIVIVLIRMIKKKWMTSNNYDSSDDNTEISYTPYDDIVMGRKPDMRRDTPIKEIDYQLDYVKKSDSNKDNRIETKR